jgi:mono/diheme cytochrome c family protein
VRLQRALWAITLAGVLLSGCGGPTGEVESPPMPQTAAERGEEVFYKHCHVCHAADTAEVIVGPGLKGFFSDQSPSPLADGTVLPRTDEGVRGLFERGTKNMPPVKGLSEQQLADVIAFLHTI